MSTNSKPNRLIHEKSPYLLQHAYNPVDWYPWGDEAFEKAGQEDKPVFLSVGYSTCHWCHVMERESFEDEEVAEYLNTHFVSIKVDREERPDVDAVYMQVCQALTGSGGWPLTVFLVPDKKAFFAGTYFPKTSRYGMNGLMEVLASVIKLWKTSRVKLLHQGDQILKRLAEDYSEQDEVITKR
ncbi:MAG: thioredoxin domain-containing protein, partial [Clostridiales bacterium]|nr:thioredoxin domain-containing protein [Clostridiales bacterium]